MATPSAPPLKHLPAHIRLRRHGHTGAYATIIVEGGYVEFGESGSIEAGPGDVLIHGCFSAHADIGGGRGARLVNLALPGRPLTGIARPADLDAVLRLAACDPRGAGEMLTDAPVDAANRAEEWPDLLARHLGFQQRRLSGLAREMGVRPETLSRGFKARYGISPQRFALEARARRAWHVIVETRDPLGRIAAETGFSDQAHMTRAVRGLTGAPPAAWRHAHLPGTQA